MHCKYAVLKDSMRGRIALFTTTEFGFHLLQYEPADEETPGRQKMQAFSSPVQYLE